MLLARGGLRTTLQTRTPEQAERCRRRARTRSTCRSVELPARAAHRARRRRARARTTSSSSASRRGGLDEVIAALPSRGHDPRAAVVSLAKGLVPPDGRSPSAVLRDALGAQRVAVVGGPGARARDGHRGRRARRRIRERGARAADRAHVHPRRRRLRASPTTRSASSSRARPRTPRRWPRARPRRRASTPRAPPPATSSPRSGASPRRSGARPESMIGLAGTGDLVATVARARRRNRRAGELLAQGVPAAEIPERIGQAVESLDLVPLLARALARRRRRGAGHERARPPDLGRAAARRLGRARAHDRPAAGALARRRCGAGFWARVRARWRAWRARARGRRRALEPAGGRGPEPAPGRAACRQRAAVTVERVRHPAVDAIAAPDCGGVGADGTTITSATSRRAPAAQRDLRLGLLDDARHGLVASPEVGVDDARRDRVDAHPARADSIASDRRARRPRPSRRARRRGSACP